MIQNTFYFTVVSNDHIHFTSIIVFVLFLLFNFITFKEKDTNVCNNAIRLKNSPILCVICNL